VYNLRVAQDHTYFVGHDDWGFSVWVHNANYVRFGSKAEVDNFNAAGGNFTGKPGAPNNDVRFGLAGSIDTTKLSSSAAKRKIAYSHKFDVDIPDEVVDLLRRMGVQEALGHANSLSVPQGSLLDLLNKLKGKVKVTKVE
jgi:hypothetical protein